MPEVRYAVFPGWIRSRTDGDRHYIGFFQLCRLYGVRPAECLDARNWDWRLLKEVKPDLIPLHAHSHGNYGIPAH